MTTALPFDDIRNLLARLPDGDARQAEAARGVMVGQGDLGHVGDLAEWLARWSGRPPQIRRPLVAIFAGNHGVARRGISAEAMEKTAHAVADCAAGAAPVNHACAANDLGLKVFDLALDLPTEDFTEAPALDERGCAATMAFGMEAIAGGADLLCLGDLGVGNRTVAAAMFAGLYGRPGRDMVGAGSDAALTARQVACVDAALRLHAQHLQDPLELLRRLGGREFAAIAGAILAARMEKIPVVLDGKVALAAAAVLHRAHAGAVDHCMSASRTGDAVAAQVHDELGLKTLLDVDAGSSAGVAAALAAGMLKGIAQIHAGLVAARR